MKPIINPLWVYFAAKSESVGTFLLLVGCISCFFAIAWCILYRINRANTSCPKWLIAIGIIGTLVGGILPSEKTILTMMTVSQITPNNIEIVGNTAQDIVDYVVDKIDEIREDKED